MEIYGIGVDLVEISRLESAIERHGEKFLRRLFTDAERAYCDPQRHAARCYAARFAAKEAVSKALGTGIGPSLGWLDIEIQRDPAGKPGVVLCGTGGDWARRVGVRTILLSLSHTDQHAIAQAVAVCA